MPPSGRCKPDRDISVLVPHGGIRYKSGRPGTTQANHVPARGGKHRSAAHEKRLRHQDAFHRELAGGGRADHQPAAQFRHRRASRPRHQHRTTANRHRRAGAGHRHVRSGGGHAQAAGSLAIDGRVRSRLFAARSGQQHRQRHGRQTVRAWRPRRRLAHQRQAVDRRVAARVRLAADAAQGARAGGVAARVRAPLRCAAGFVHRRHRLRARRHARARQPGLPGNLRLRQLR